MIILTSLDKSGAVASIAFDIDMQETHELQTQITEHPVEEGADVADHVRDDLETFRVEGYVSDSPILENPGAVDKMSLKSIELQLPEMPSQLSLSAAVNAGINAVGTALFGGAGAPKAVLVTLDDLKSRKREFYRLINKWRTEHRLIRVITAVREYENMLITQISMTRDPGSGDGASFVVALRQVQFVSSETVDAPQPSEPLGATKKAAGSKNAGADSSATVEEKKKSILKRAASGAAGILGL